MLDGFEPTSY